MQAAFAELPLALFTTLAPLGAGAFVALALAFFTTSFTDEQFKRIDRMTCVPLAVVLVGFVASFAHLASPLHALSVFAHTGSSPLSNEIVVGSLFVLAAITYTVLAVAGKLSGSARKGFAAVVAVLAVAFALFVGLAYVMDTIASWNTPLVPVQMVGFSLLGGSALGTLVLGLSQTLDDALKGAYRYAVLAMALLGAVLGIVGLCGQVLSVGAMFNALVLGSDLVAAVQVWLAVAVACFVLGALAVVAASRGRNPIVLTGGAVVVLVVGIFVARLVFYAVQLSVGL